MLKLKRLLLPQLFVLLSFYAVGQCDGVRFFAPITDEFETTLNVKYGENLDVDGDNTELFFDFYEPKDDVPGFQRPLIILAHGGSFIGGSRTGDDVVPLAIDLAKHGFAVASISYRLGIEGFPLGVDSVTASEAVVRAVHDMRAAVRFFRKSAGEGNTFRIDPDNIYAAGVSAGAFMALHLAYLDTDEEIPTYVDQDRPDLQGGIEGNSGNPGFSSEVKAVVNIAGALKEKEWMQANDEPLISFHGTEDNTVPYGSDMLFIAGFIEIFEVDGSASIHERAQEVGVFSCMETQYGQDHIPHTGNAQYYDTLMVMTRNFLASNFCASENNCEYGSLTDLAELSLATPLSLHPNPTNGIAQFSSRVNGYEVFNMTGKKVMEAPVKKVTHFIDLSSLESGVYVIRTEGRSLRVLKQ